MRLIFAVAIGLCTCCAAIEDRPGEPRLLIELPDAFNTPDGADLDSDGNVVLSVPNFSNDHLIETGVITQPSPAVMARIDGTGISTWYAFGVEDLHPDTGRVGPMDCAFGPDGNLYVADLQVLWDPAHKSRVLRVNVEDGVARSVDVVVEGLVAANGTAWRGETLFVTDSIVAVPADGGAPLTSGVYAFSLAELSTGPVVVRPRASGARADGHLAVVFESSNTMGFGADGVVLDDRNNLYTSVIEDGRIYKTTFDAGGAPAATTLFVDDSSVRSADGLAFDPRQRTIYVADPKLNAVHRVDLEGDVAIVHRNEDTDGTGGALDQPVEVLVRERQLIVVNMDVAWLMPPPDSVNTRTDRPYTVSVIDLE